jgi:DNA-binding SARP family transcriptional activator/tRNA A-37 threonylcarbamoyl transferase component Bud32
MIRIDTLGSTRVFVDSREATVLASQNLRCALLIYIAVEKNTTRDKVLAVFWAEQDDKSGRHALSQNLYELKKLLGENWLRPQGEELIINDPLQLDVNAFTEAIERSDYPRALEVYRGPFLRAGPLVDAHPFQEWVDQRAFKLRRMWIRAGHAHVEHLIGAGEIDRAVRVARNVVELEPQEDQLQHQLIDLLRRSGRRNEALEQYELYERALREDDLEPLDETKALIERIREGESRPEFVITSVTGSARTASLPAAPDIRAGAQPHPDTVEGLELQLKSELQPGLEINRLLGSGGFASVYLAREPGLRRLVAVKVLWPKVARDPTVRLRFEREAQAIASISHPNVVTVFRVDRLSNDLPFLVMQYVKGRSLADLLQAEGRMEVADVRRIIADLAAALSATHKKGIVHRDVRPANVLIEDETGRAVLTDFGIAAIMERGDERPLNLTRTGEMIGDPAYMSPEQRMGRSLTELADVYSVGVLGYELLTGRKPLIEAGAEPPRIGELRPDVDAALEAALHRCLSSNPAHRPSAADLGRQLTASPGPGYIPTGTTPVPQAVTPVTPVPAATQPAEDVSPAQSETKSTGLSWLMAELKRRRVFRVTGAYVVAAVVVVEGANNFFGALRLPAWTNTLVAALAILGLPLVIALAWAFDITSKGVVRTKPSRRE